MLIAGPKKLLSLMGGLIALMLLSTACATSSGPGPSAGQSEAGPGQAPGQPKYGGVITILMFIGGDPKSFDTTQESDVAVLEAVGATYENLIKFNPLKPEEVVPDLAEKWELAPDGKSYTFHLRKGVKFHNGDPFASADVKFSLERVKNPPPGIVSPRRDTLGAVSSIETPDEYTVKVNLSRPNPSLLNALSQGWVTMFDKKWLEPKGDRALEREAMGTGPFRLKEYIRGTSVELEKNKDYYQKGLPYLDGKKTYIIPDPGTRLAALRTGQVMLYDISRSDLRMLQQEMSDKLDFAAVGSLGYSALVPNTTRKPYSDARVREALNLAMDRYAAVEVTQQGAGDIGGFMRAGGPWSLPKDEVAKFPGYGKEKTRDIARAKELLAQAGYPNGFSADVLTTTAASYQDLAVFMVDQLKKIGINATLKSQLQAEAYTLVRNGDFDMIAWRFGFAIDDPDAVYSEFYTCDAPRNWSKLCTADVDDLYNKQSQEVDPAKRKALVMELEKKAVPTASKIITQWNDVDFAKWKFVKNYVRHPSYYNNHRFLEVWLDR